MAATGTPAKAAPRKGGSRGEVAMRTIAALGGSYVLTALAAACAARLLPMERVEATTAATLGAFFLYPIFALAAFSARSTARVWLWMTGAALALATGLSLTLITGGRA